MSFRPKPKPSTLTIKEMQGLMQSASTLEDVADPKLVAELTKRGYAVSKKT